MSTFSVAIRTKLAAASDITDWVGTRIYPEFLPQNATLPALTYARTTLQSGAVLDQVQPTGPSAAGVQIQAFGSRYNELQDLAEDVDDVMINLVGDIATASGTLTVQGVVRDNAQDISDLDGDKLTRRVILDYTVYYTGGKYV